jgi:hypothetical protein
MKYTKTLVTLVALIALFAVSVANVSAFGSITGIEVAGVDAYDNSVELATFNSDTLPVLVVFEATEDATDVRVKVWLSGSNGYSAASERFDVIAGKTYARVISVKIPSTESDILDEALSLEISVENKNQGIADLETVSLNVQRESYVVEVLDAIHSNQVTAGENLAIDVIIKNKGRQFADDTFVVVAIPALGISERAYFGDLSAVDQDDPDKEDAAERRVYLNIPKDAPAGVYIVEVSAFNDDSLAESVSKVAIVGASEDTMIVSGTSARTVNAGETAEYSITLVNAGNRVRVYELITTSPIDLDVELSEPVVAIPAGVSKTVKVYASAEKAGGYDFSVDVLSDSALVKTEDFRVSVEGTSRIGSGTAANGTVLLTVILAIVFIVLLVVLIVLLTRKPEEERTEEFGESYY